MKQIHRYIKSKLKDNVDLIDIQLIDNSLTYKEQKEDLRKYINPLINFEDKLKDLIQNYPMGFNTLSKKDIWHRIRVCWG